MPYYQIEFMDFMENCNDFQSAISIMELSLENN